MTDPLSLPCLVGMLLILTVSAANAADSLSLSATPGKSYGRYQSALVRDYLEVTSINLDAQMPRQWGFSLGLERTRIHFKYGIPDYQQDAVFVSYQSINVPRHQLPGLALKYLPHVRFHNPGMYTTRLDAYCVADRKDKNTAENACIFAPQISYTRLDYSLYTDLGYAVGKYASGLQDSGALRVEQWTPTLGLALDDSHRHWLQLRGYIIRYSNELRSHRKDQTKAVEAKYYYYPASKIKILPLFVEVTALGGERMYSVDRDTASVNNLADLEKAGYTLSARWQLGKSLDLLISASRSLFNEQTVLAGNDYTITSRWIGITTKW